MLKRSFSILLVAALLLVVMSVSVFGQDEEQTEFHLRGTYVQLIGQYPHSFSYDGSSVVTTDLPGFFELHLDAENDIGMMFARFYVSDFQFDADTLLEEAQITVIYPLFGMPIMPKYFEGGIATDVLLHGDSGQEAPVLPTVFNEVASWGPAMVFINGEQYLGPEEMMGGPNLMRALSGHMMYSNSPRDPETGLVANAADDGPYSPMTPSDALPYDEEATLLHLVVHTDDRDEEAFPPVTMFLHVNFLDVVEIDAAEGVEDMYLSFAMINEMMETMEAEEVMGSMEEWVMGIMEMIDATEAELDEASSDS